MNLAYFFLLFLFYSVLGWVVEIIYTRIVDKKWVNRGFLMGPYCPIYGYGCILIILLLKKYYNDPVILVAMSMIICSVLEYLTSFIMEKLFRTRWWDYSNRKFNINGRICLETMVPFGLAGLLLIYVLNPFISGLILKMPNTLINISAIVLFILFILDNIISFVAITKIHISTNKLKVDSTEEITKKVKEYLSSHSKFGKRLINSFPNLKTYQKKIKKQTKKRPK